MEQSMIQAVTFITDEQGNPKAAILDITLWREILRLLETIDETQLKSELRQLRLADLSPKTSNQVLPKPAQDPLLQWIGAVSHGKLAHDIDEDYHTWLKTSFTPK